MECVFHISEQPGIACFEPRPAPSRSSQSGAMVWAVDDAHLHNYLLPRDCPRITFYAVPSSHPADVARLMPGCTARAVVAIEAAWLPQIRQTRLYRYDLPAAQFTCVDAGAGYYIARTAVTPIAEHQIDDPLGLLLARQVELRVMPSLWPLRDLVIEATLQFSIIRMRNAQPPPAGYQVRTPL